MFAEDDIEPEVEQFDYRDRAEERRKGVSQEIKQGDVVELEGFEKEVKLKGLDFSLITQNIQSQIKPKDKASVIAKIKKDLQTVKENKPKKTVHPMAIKIEAFLQLRKKNEKTTAHKMNYMYKYDTDSNYGISMPQFFTKKKSEDSEVLVQMIYQEEVLKMIKDSRTNTNQLNTRRYLDRYTFDQKIIIKVDENENEGESEDIFNDAKELKKPNIDISKIVEIEKEEIMFDIKDYINNNLFDQKQYNSLKEQIQLEAKEKEEKLKKHKQMLEGEDYYYECYQPVGLSIAEEKEHKEEADAKKMVNPEFKEFDFIKQDFTKKKRKRVNLQNQLDQIEDILQKKTK